MVKQHKIKTSSGGASILHQGIPRTIFSPPIQQEADVEITEDVNFHLLQSEDDGSERLSRIPEAGGRTFGLTDLLASAPEV